MSLSEKLVLVLFLGAIVVVYASALVIVVGAVYRRIRRRKSAASRFRRIVRIIVLVLAAVGIGCMAYGYFIEPYWLETTHEKLVSDKLPPGSRPIRIVQISDLHCDGKERLEGSLPDVIAELKPDVIVFTGDAVNSLDGLPHFRRCMGRLAMIAPTYAVAGNLDVPKYPNTDVYQGTKVRVLEAECAELRVGSARIRFAGAPVGRWSALEGLLQRLEKDVFTVVLYHYPDEVAAAARHSPDLYLAGHTHGGQVALPGYGALITLSRFGKRYEAGLYRVGQTWLYVNRGIGMEGRMAPRVRFCARPEVTLIEISPAASSPGGTGAPE